MVKPYPTKDYHDFFKGYYSEDCTKENKLASKHLQHPSFFNLRVLLGVNWIGNIYMLDLIDQTGSLIIDRIQLKKGIEILAPKYIPVLKETLIYLLKDVDYKMILVPGGVISNYQFIQTCFDRFKKNNKIQYLRLGYYETGLQYFECFKRKEKSVFLIFNRKE